MSDTISTATTEGTLLRRRLWTVPQLVAHDSMMVLTQHFFGAPAAALMIQQGNGITCVVGSGVNC